MARLSRGKTRRAVALLLGITIGAAVVTAFVLAINCFDWGIGLIPVAPLLIWLLLRMGRALERWANSEADTLSADPDFPDDQAQ